jgi:dienelactone hydrolase
MKWLFRFVVIMIGLSLVNSLASNAAADEELDRTWAGGLIFYPKDGRFAFGKIASHVGLAQAAIGNRKLPVIVYMHGCSGLDLLSKQTARDHVLDGFVVVMPDSYARANKPPSCILEKHQSGLHRSVIFWRQNEANNAIRNARLLPFADPRNVFLAGLSEGAITTATVKGEPVNARIIEGWTCHAGWAEYAGLAAPESEPVLSFTSVDDPWFQNVWARGDCGKFMSKTNGSMSVVFGRDHVLHDQHFVMWHKEAKDRARAFLKAHLKQ